MSRILTSPRRFNANFLPPVPPQNVAQHKATAGREKKLESGDNQNKQNKEDFEQLLDDAVFSLKLRSK